MILVLAAAGGKYLWSRRSGPDSRADGQTAPAVQVQPEPAGRELRNSPPPQEPGEPAAKVSARQVLEKVLSVWGSCLARGNYTQFHALISAQWQSQDTVQQLARAYQPLEEHRTLMEMFPRRGKLVVLESRPLTVPAGTEETVFIRDTLGPESPWLVRGEWRTGRSALGFALNLVWESNQWRPAGLRVEVYKPGIGSE
ncbi:MAG: hypothetical protein LBK52_01140 [Deltaproteobacteria bacterium]|nr:hypothetical protein [Deltaproteobacteria bacterium]